MASFPAEDTSPPYAQQSYEGTLLYPVLGGEIVNIENNGTIKPQVITKQNRVIRK